MQTNILDVSSMMNSGGISDDHSDVIDTRSNNNSGNIAENVLFADQTQKQYETQSDGVMDSVMDDAISSGSGSGNGESDMIDPFNTITGTSPFNSASESISPLMDDSVDLICVDLSPMESELNEANAPSPTPSKQQQQKLKETVLDGIVNDQGEIQGVHVLPSYIERLGQEKSVNGRGTLLTALHRTRDITIMNHFVNKTNGLATLGSWLQEHKNKPKLMKFISRVLLQLPMSIDALRRSQLGKIVKKLCKSPEIVVDEELKQRLNSCLKKWMNLAHTNIATMASPLPSPSASSPPSGGSGSGSGGIFAKLSSGANMSAAVPSIRIPKKTPEQRKLEQQQEREREQSRQKRKSGEAKLEDTASSGASRKKLKFSDDLTEFDRQSANQQALDSKGKKRVRWAASNKALFNVKYFDKEQPPTVLQDKPTAEQMRANKEISKQSAAALGKGMVAPSMEKQDTLRERHELEKQRRQKLVEIELRKRKLREMVSETPWYPPEELDLQTMYTIHRETIPQRGSSSQVKANMERYVKDKEPARHIGGVIRDPPTEPETAEVLWDDAKTSIIPLYTMNFQQPQPQLQPQPQHQETTLPQQPSNDSFVEKLKSALRGVPQLASQTLPPQPSSGYMSYQPQIHQAPPPPPSSQPRAAQHEYYDIRGNASNVNRVSYSSSKGNNGYDSVPQPYLPQRSSSYGNATTPMYGENNASLPSPPPPRRPPQHQGGYLQQEKSSADVPMRYGSVAPAADNGRGTSQYHHQQPQQYYQHPPHQPQSYPYLHQQQSQSPYPTQPNQPVQQQFHYGGGTGGDGGQSADKHYNFLVKGITNKRHPLYKTVRCRFYDPATGAGCMHGDKCPFFHAGVDPVPRDGIVREPIPAHLIELKKRINESEPTRRGGGRRVHNRR